MVGGSDHHWVVFHDDDRIAMVGQVAEDPGEGGGIARVEGRSSAHPHVQRAYQSRAELIGQGDPLCFPA